MASGMKCVAEGIYRKKGKLYERVQRDDKDTFISIPATTLKEARTIRATRIAKHGQYKEGMIKEDPYARRRDSAKTESLDALCQVYLDAGCPDKRRRFKVGKQLESEKDRVATLRTWPGWTEQPVAAINLATLDRYEAWRRNTSKKMKNGRTVDMEIVTLKNVLRWAVRGERLTVNPLATIEITSYQKGPACHARDKRPDDAAELHALAGKLFAWYNSEVLGFQMLFEAFTGVRTSEALACRWDAKPGEPGYIDGDLLYLGRLKGGVNPWVTIHPALRALLDAMLLWRNTRKNAEGKLIYADAKPKWFFPSHVSPAEPVEASSLTHALRRISPAKPITSHGMRAYYVGVRRSEFIPDAVIAAEIGDKTGASIIESTYGPLPPNWKTATAGKITWLTEKGEPAWEVFRKQIGENVIAISAAG